MAVKKKNLKKSAQALKMTQSTIIVLLEIQERKVADKNTINITTAVLLSWFHHAAKTLQAARALNFLHC